MFNALKYTQELEKAGFTREQAEVSMKLLIDTMNENFATKSDFKEFGLRVESKLQELEHRIGLRFQELELKTGSKFQEFGSRFHVVDSSIHSLEQKMNSGFKEMEYKLTIKLATILGTMMTLAISVTAVLVRFTR